MNGFRQFGHQLEMNISVNVHSELHTFEYFNLTEAI